MKMTFKCLQHEKYSVNWDAIILILHVYIFPGFCFLMIGITNYIKSGLCSIPAEMCASKGLIHFSEGALFVLLLFHLCKDENDGMACCILFHLFILICSLGSLCLGMKESFLCFSPCFVRDRSLETTFPRISCQWSSDLESVRETSSCEIWRIVVK